MYSTKKLINVSSRQLQVFQEICRRGSFAAAAERIHLSPSGVSMMVKELERQLGVRLFERTTRALTPTDAGTVLLRYAEKIVADVRQLGLALQTTASVERSTLTIAATPVIATCLLPKVVASFAQNRPDVRIHIIDGSLDTVRQALVDGRADLGIAFFVKPTAGIVREPVSKFRLVGISPPESPAPAVHGQRSWKSLGGLPLIALPVGNPIQALIDAHLPDAKASQAERNEMNFLGSILAMVQAGLGHAVVPSFMVQECQQLGLGVDWLEEPPVHLNMYAARRRGTADNVSAILFVEALKEHLRTATALDLASG